MCGLQIKGFIFIKEKNHAGFKELNEVIAAIKEEIRQGADALTTSRSVYEFKKTFLDNKQAGLVC